MAKKIEKDDLVSFLHSFLVVAPRIITIDDPSFMLGEKVLSRLTSIRSHCLANQVEIGVCPCAVLEWSSS